MNKMNIGGNMKIKQEHYEYMKQAIAPLIGKVPAHIEYLKAEGKAKDYNKRLRWDLMYAANLSTFVCDNLYNYMDDTHIDTALRAIMKELNIPEV
jgi:hypothetical protein